MNFVKMQGTGNEALRLIESEQSPERAAARGR